MRLAVYSGAHFLVDLACALGVLGRMVPAGDGALVILLYNFFAFAGQMPLGLAADRLDRNHRVAALGCGLVALAWFLPHPLAGAVCAGTGNALFHVGGGLDTLHSSGGRVGPLGIFVSPGALGIFLGGLWSGRAESLALPVCALLVLCALGILGTCRSGPSNGPAQLPERMGPVLPGLICLFLVVVLRSWGGFLFSFPWKARWSLALVCATALGKAAGGLLADQIGPRTTAVVTLALSALCFLGSDLPGWGLGAVFLFNMTMPLTLWAAARRLPQVRGFAFGLLTFALFLGFLPAFLGWTPLAPGPAVYAGVALASLVLLLPGLKGGGPC